MYEPPPQSFEATLSLGERRLASRLEGFGDIVFGFAISQCALQLPTANGHVTMLAPFSILLYFGTFSLVATLWLGFHRLMSGTFSPTGIDLFGAFAYLALVSLFPYAMYGITHTFANEAAARTALVQYAGLYAAIMAIAASLTLRSMRRGWYHTTPRDRDAVWTAFVRRVVLAIEMASALVLDVTFGPAIAGFFLFTIPVVVRVSRMRFAHAPSRLAPPVDTRS